MTPAPKDPKEKGKKGSESGYENPPDVTPRREGGDDALAETDPQDSRADEKIIVNEQREHKAVNTPSQTAPHTSELEGSEGDVL